MSRPGFVLEVDEKTPRLLTMAGADLRLERFGPGTRVVYHSDPAASKDPVTLIDAALASPVGAEPLQERLSAGMKLTIVIADSLRPQPRMRFDIRRSIVERVLEQAARAGVDDVQLVVASGLNRRWSPRHVSEVLGERVATSFLPDGLVTSHDVTSTDLADLGEVDGHQVRLNARVANSDLVVLVTTCDGVDEDCPFAVGLTDVATINRITGLRGDADAAARVSQAICAQVPTFCVMAVLGQPLMSAASSFMNKREWEWRPGDQLAFATARQLVAALPRQGARRVFGDPTADYAVIDLIGGDVAHVSREAHQVWRAANAVELPGQADVLVTSVWGGAFDPGNPAGSPVNAAHHAIVDQAGSHAGTPFVRDGGSLIAFHPLTPNFSNRIQSSVADFFTTVLPETLEPAEIAERFEQRAATDPWYLNLYREHFAHHPLSVFHAWYRMRRASAGLGEVIWVGADRRSAAVLGHRAASTFADALEIASDNVGPHPAVTHLHGPGRVLGLVR